MALGAKMPKEFFAALADVPWQAEVMYANSQAQLRSPGPSREEHP